MTKKHPFWYLKRIFFIWLPPLGRGIKVIRTPCSGSATHSFSSSSPLASIVAVASEHSGFLLHCSRTTFEDMSLIYHLTQRGGKKSGPEPWPHWKTNELESLLGMKGKATKKKNGGQGYMVGDFLDESFGAGTRNACKHLSLRTALLRYLRIRGKKFWKLC